MAIKVFERYSPRANPADNNYPTGSFKNESVPGANDGTPLEVATINDLQGFTDALMAENNTAASGSPDTAVSSQRMDVLKRIFHRSYDGVADMLAATNHFIGLTYTTGTTVWVCDVTGTAADIGDFTPHNALNVMDFGAIGDGVTDDTVPIQATLDAVRSGGSVYIPKIQWGQPIKPPFRTTAQLTCTRADIAIYGDPASEFSGGIVCEESVQAILFLQNPGCKVSDISFYGNGSNTTFGTSIAIEMDRRANGNTDNEANLDVIVTKCNFFDVHTSVKGYGRNVNVNDCLHTHVKVGVHCVSFIADNLEWVDVRGWRITENRFHSVGWQYGFPGSTETLPTTFGTWDSWCIIMPSDAENFRHVEVTDNNFDRGYAGFYRGSLAGANINSNTGHDFNGAFVYGFVESAAIANQRAFPGRIADNLVNYRESYVEAWDVAKTYGIWANETDLLAVVDNTIKNTLKQGILLTACDHFNGSDNMLQNVGQDKLNANPAVSAMKLVNCSTGTVDSLTVSSKYGDTSFNTSGIEMTGCERIAIGNPSITNAVVPISGGPEELASGANYGLGWVNPALTAPFTYNAGPGYQRMIDGTTHVNLRVLNNGASSGAVVFTLPVGARPTADVKQNGVGSNQFATASISASTGQVSISITGSAPALSNISLVFPSK